MTSYAFDILVDRVTVLCCSCALARSGLTAYGVTHLDMMTQMKVLDNFCMVYATYYYYPYIDFEHFVTPETTNPLILKPTKERAIVEYILNEKWCDEGILIEALKTYLQWFRNDEELYCVADFFGLDRKTLDYWIKEALEDAEV